MGIAQNNMGRAVNRDNPVQGPSDMLVLALANAPGGSEGAGAAQFRRVEGMTAGMGRVAATGEALQNAWWYEADADQTRWNRLYPYELAVVESATDKVTGKTTFTRAGSFALPIPPEALSISMPFAVNTHVTMGGIIEEHNGAPLRMISLRGTTGLIPLKAPSTGKQAGTFDWSSAILSGTIQAGRDLAQTVTALGQAAGGAGPVYPNALEMDEIDGTPLGITTGYTQLHLLRKFLENYAKVKKGGAKNWHLAICMWKDQATYLVTPITFDVNRDASSPLEYNYSLQLKAWRRINLSEGGIVSRLKNLPIRHDPSALARAMNTIKASRRVLKNVSDLGPALQGDFDRLVGEPLRELTLFCKDALGAAQSLAELPAALVKQGAGYWKLAGDSINEIGSTASQVGKNIKNVYTRNKEKQTTGPALEGSKQALYQGTHPGNSVFDKQDYETMDQIQVSDARLPDALRAKIQNEIDRVASKTRKDFEADLSKLTQAADKLAVLVGVSSAKYDENYSNPNAGAAVRKTPTQSDWDTVYALEDAINVMRSFAATDDGSPVKAARVNSIDVMGQLARRSGIAFQRPASKFAIPFPYSGTLEGLAAQYLGDADRWHEIAALNGLREPYIDEVGFSMPLAVNGADDEIVVARTTNLYVGQAVFVSSRVAGREKCRVMSLKNTGSTTVVKVDAEVSMSAYKVVDNAILEAFLPDTINSQNLIYIPSAQEPASNNNVTKSIPGVSEFDPMVSLGGVDLLLDNNNDLIITPDGDCRLAVGLTNIVQHVKIALNVEKGTLNQHPDYGLPIKVGDSIAETSAGAVSKAIKDMFANDPTFSSVDAVRVEMTGGTAKINVALTARGCEQPVPVAFDVKR